jgi:hypothetical protein
MLAGRAAKGVHQSRTGGVFLCRGYLISTADRRWRVEVTTRDHAHLRLAVPQSSGGSTSRSECGPGVFRRCKRRPLNPEVTRPIGEGTPGCDRAASSRRVLPGRRVGDYAGAPGALIHLSPRSRGPRNARDISRFQESCQVLLGPGLATQLGKDKAQSGSGHAGILQVVAKQRQLPRRPRPLSRLQGDSSLAGASRAAPPAALSRCRRLPCRSRCGRRPSPAACACRRRAP